MEIEYLVLFINKYFPNLLWVGEDSCATVKLS